VGEEGVRKRDRVVSIILVLFIIGDGGGGIGECEVGCHSLLVRLKH